MKKILLPIFMCAALAACGDNADENVVRHCGKYDVEMNFSETGEILTAIINGDTVELTLATSASGAKYDGVVNDTPVTLWSKGDNWIMILDDDTVIECATK